MQKNRITHIEALRLLKNGETIDHYTIQLSGEKVEALDALLLSDNNVVLPEDLIFYNDEDINFEDIPPITDADIEDGLLVKPLNVRLKTTKEVTEWVQSSKINLDVLATRLIEDFYRNMKTVKS